MTTKDNRPIGIFDSGVGGLTIVREVLSQLPNEEIVYFGDTLRAPYGGLDTQTITAYTLQICDFLIEQNIKALVVACNTIDALCLEAITKAYQPLPIIGVIEPACRKTATVANASVGLMATVASVRSGAHEKMLRSFGGRQAFYSCPCPTLVPLVEDLKLGTDYAKQEVRKYTEELLSKGIDALILGCTHYPFLRPEVEAVTGDKITIIDPALYTVSALAQTLQNLGAQRQDPHPPQHKFYISGDTSKFFAIYRLISPDTPDVTNHILRK